MESTESRFAHLLQPIRELTKNWDIDVAAALNDYLEEVKILQRSHTVGCRHYRRRQHKGNGHFSVCLLLRTPAKHHQSSLKNSSHSKFREVHSKYASHVDRGG